MTNQVFLSEDYFNLTEVSFKDIFSNITNVWEALPKITEYIRAQFRNGTLKANYKNKEFVSIGEGTVIHESVEIVGPAIIGKNSVISHAAYLREGCIIGNNVHIGHAAEIKHAVILNNAIVAHLNYIGDSIIGNNVNIAGGTILANYRLDKKPVAVKIDDTKIDTHLEKFGAVIGDNANIGVNVALNPGTILGKNSLVYPLVSVSGVHKHDAVIK